MSRCKIIVIGGSAAGPKAAAKARRLDQNADIKILQKDEDLSMASCGFPYYIGGTFNDRNSLICTPAGTVRDSKFFMNAKAIDARTSTEVVSIDRNNHTVTSKSLIDGSEEIHEYDKLIICTGSNARKPPIPGIEFEGVSTLKSMGDVDYLRKLRDEGNIKNAVVVGGGLIGIEVCEALKLSGISVTVVELLPQVLMFLDPELAKLVENHVCSKSVNVVTNNGITEFLGEKGKLKGVRLQDGTVLSCELALVSIGVQPNTKLAIDAGLKIGSTGAISVNEYMQTSDPDIYAAGDCVEVKNIVTDKNVYAPLGDLANLQGRVIGENIINGNSSKFSGTILTSICKVFDFTAGATGISETAARKLGYDIETVVSAGPDKPGFMGGLPLISKLVVQKSDGRILGYQCVGMGDVSRQIATAAIAVQNRLTYETIINADLPYAPPFSPAIDHFICTAHVMENKLRGRLIGISSEEVLSKLKSVDKPFIIDARGPDEYEQMRLGIGEVLIPLGMLRKRLGELPSDKNKEIICYCKISLRGYETALILQANGWKNVKVMEGGIIAWPFKREK